MRRVANSTPVVDPGERTTAAALTQLAWIALPFVVDGGLRIADDLTLSTFFRPARPTAPDT
ncbi:hypothetical protein [Streptomyces griseus]|uniref:hypothetical protein n=1 Tax=Streptomyces griseus TaxID=1911 RepID=UPI00131A9C44|nr:hypothetical protein [Streptomyces griseus]